MRRIEIKKVLGKKGYKCQGCPTRIKKGEQMFVISNERGIPIVGGELCMKCGIDYGNEWRAILESMDL